MKKLNLFLTFTLLIVLSEFSVGQTPTFEWAKQMGGTDYDIGYGITTDINGNVYTIGRFNGTADFDPGVGITNLTSLGGDNIFIQKLDASGNLIWVKQMSGTTDGTGHSITIDIHGNVYSTGWFEGIVDFDPSAGVSNLTSNGYSDIFIQKLDANGNFIWAKQMGGTGYDLGQSISTDDNGNVYSTGYFRNTVDFDPGVGITNFTSAGGNDIFIQKLDSIGNLVWAKHLGGTSSEWGYGIDIDGNGNVYTTGGFQGTMDFDPNGGTFNLTSAGGNDIYIQKLDSSGNFLWAKGMGGADSDGGVAIEIDTIGNVYSTGTFRSTVDFDPGIGTTNLTSTGGNDLYIQKLDSNGDLLWVKGMGGTNHDYINGIAIDISENVYTVGHFQGTVDFDPGTGTTNLFSAGSNDIFIQKLDHNGDFEWVTQMGGASSDNGNSITTDSNGNVYSTGFFQSAGDFDPSVGTSNLTSIGATDIFIQKLSQCSATTGTDVLAACDSLTWIDGNTYSTSNNTATYIFTNAAGCDSVVTLNLTIGDSENPVPNNGSLSDLNSECEVSPTAPTAIDNCAGILQGIPDIAFPITTSGTTIITWTYNDGNGNLYTQTQNVIITPIDNGITQVDAITLTADATGYNYQWVDCDNGNAAVSGATSQSFTATLAGNYACEIDNGTCTVTTTCLTSSVGIEENGFGSALIVYPNPTFGDVRIYLGATYNETTVKVFNFLGQIIINESFGSTAEINMNLEGAPGMYILEINTEAGRTTRVNIIKE